jgi:uncharacterized protein (DUF2062 family)
MVLGSVLLGVVVGVSVVAIALVVANYLTNKRGRK